jgi:hypothetical protein
VAAGHLASHQACLACMVALHWGAFLCHGLRFRSALCFRMSVRETHRSRAACHPACLEGGAPRRSPEQHRSQQTHPRAKVSSRSDRNVEPLFHGRVGKLYINLRLLSKRCRNSSNLLVAKGPVPRRIVWHPLGARPCASATLSRARSPSIVRMRAVWGIGGKHHPSLSIAFFVRHKAKSIALEIKRWCQ